MVYSPKFIYSFNFIILLKILDRWNGHNNDLDMWVFSQGCVLDRTCYTCPETIAHVTPFKFQLLTDSLYQKLEMYGKRFVFVSNSLIDNYGKITLRNVTK